MGFHDAWSQVPGITCARKYGPSTECDYEGKGAQNHVTLNHCLETESPISQVPWSDERFQTSAGVLCVCQDRPASAEKAPALLFQGLPTTCGYFPKGWVLRSLLHI